MSRKAKLIAFDGPDRVGKATQSTMLVELLKSSGYRAIRIEVPVKNCLHELIYVMLKDGSAKEYPHFFQALQVANRLLFQIFDLPRLMRENDYIILDRWSSSTWVYGRATGLDQQYVERLTSFVRKPDFTIILNGEPQVTETRDVYEADATLQKSVRNLYYEYATLNNVDTVAVQANQSRNDLLGQITFILTQKGIIKEIRNV
jgi:dTMP kinase